MSIQIKMQPKGLLDLALESVVNNSKSRGVIFTTHLADNLPESFYCDKTKLCQVLTALTDQAVRRTTQGSVTVKVEMVQAAAGRGGQMAFSIEDTGSALDRDLIDMVLNLDIPISSWPREHSSNEMSVGLRMSSKLISLLGGSLKLDSTGDNTTRFTFSIPVKLDSSLRSAIVSNPQPVAIQHPIKAEETNTLAANVLVVDDVPENRSLIEVLLRKMGHKVSFAVQGQQAVEMCKTQEYDVILMDIQMPVMDGLEATRQIRLEGLNTRTTILALTASIDKRDEFKALDAGCDDCLSKPVDRKKLERKLWRIVAKLKQVDDAEHGNTIVSFLEGDPDYQKAIETFIENLPTRVDEIKSAYEKGDFKDLAFKVHSLKGLGGFAGFPVFTEKAKLMEQNIKSNDLDKVQAQVDELVGLCLRTKLKNQAENK